MWRDSIWAHSTSSQIRGPPLWNMSRSGWGRTSSSYWNLHEQRTVLGSALSWNSNQHDCKSSGDEEVWRDQLHNRNPGQNQAQERVLHTAQLSACGCLLVLLTVFVITITSTRYSDKGLRAAGCSGSGAVSTLLFIIQDSENCSEPSWDYVAKGKVMMIYVHFPYTVEKIMQTLTFQQLSEITQGHFLGASRSSAILGTEENVKAQTLFYLVVLVSLETEEDNE
ncbi:hypothetical protein QTO34_005295 [Cnephaeus nilssonii]|uniref:Uncharacterized protein n=1 Tax=Cnephaeus nilssonii TaxID=3371016 RepID=A0AA40LJ86_CNENI|nr:hypothetical protein QTO34_005295 [Eptesicus nilssonii]